MENKEYLNIISKEIKNNEELLKHTNNLIVFYINLEGEESTKVKELLKNRDLYNTRIKMLNSIENLPLYQSIKNMDDEEIKKYKEKIISRKIKEIEEISNEINKLKQDIIHSNNDIESFYKLFEKCNDKVYIEEAKKVLNHINSCKQRIENSNEKKEFFQKIINNFNKLSKEEIKVYIMNESDLSSNLIENSLNMYKPNRIDKLVVPLSKDLEVLDTIIDNMKKYNILKDKEVYQSIYISSILNDYTFNEFNEKSAISWLVAELDDSKLWNNVLKLYSAEDFDILKESIECGMEKVESDNAMLESYKDIINQFPKNADEYDLYDLKVLNDNLENSETVKRLIEIINEYKILYSKGFLYKEEKQELIKLKSNECAKEILDILWKSIIDKIIDSIKNINNNTVFYRKLNIRETTEEIINNNPMIIETDNYSTLNLFNIKILIEQILSKYNDIIDTLNKLKNECEDKKIEFIKLNKEKDIKLKAIEDNINNLYKKVSNQELNVDDYNNIVNVFKNNTIIDSIAKVEIEELTNKINEYSLNNENIFNEFTKNDNNQKQEDNVKEESFVKDNKENIKEKNNNKNKINEEDLKKIKDTIKKLGLNNEQIRGIIEKVIKDDILINNVLKLDKKGTLNKEKIKNIIKDIKIDGNTDLIVLISELYEKLDLDKESLNELGNEILKNRSLIIDILKSNKKILFNMFKNDVMKKILKK